MYHHLLNLSATSKNRGSPNNNEGYFPVVYKGQIHNRQQDPAFFNRFQYKTTQTSKKYIKIIWKKGNQKGSKGKHPFSWTPNLTYLLTHTQVKDINILHTHQNMLQRDYSWNLPQHLNKPLPQYINEQKQTINETQFNTDKIK